MTANRRDAMAAPAMATSTSRRIRLSRLRRAVADSMASSAAIATSAGGLAREATEASMPSE